MSLSLDSDLSSFQKKEPVFDGSTSQAIQPLPDDAKSSYGGCTLPSGYLDESGKIHKDCILKEMTGEEEDILTSQKLPVPVRFNRVLQNCVSSIGSYDNKHPKYGDVIRSLTAGDRLFLIIQLRILSLSPIYAAKSQCSNCQNYTLQHVDLNKFDIKGITDPDVRTWEILLPSQKKATLKALDGWEEVKQAKELENNNRDIPTLAMWGRIVELDGKQPVKLIDLKKLSWKDRNAIRESYVKKEGKFDTSIEYTCANCGTEVKEEVNVNHPSFFFPSAMSDS